MTVLIYLIVPSAPGFEEIPFGEKEIIRTKSVKLFFLDYEIPAKSDRKLKKIKISN